MSHIILSSVACLALLYSSTLSHNRHTFRKTFLNFLDRFSKNTKISYCIKIRSVEAELFHADGQTDTTKLIVSLHNLANAPENVSHRTRIFGNIYIYIYNGFLCTNTVSYDDPFFGARSSSICPTTLMQTSPKYM